MKGVCTMVEDIKIILEKLLKMDVEELACYDVKREDGILQDYINTCAFFFNRTSEKMDELSPWERMCYYRVSGGIGTDCDVALFTVVVYYLAFGLGKGWILKKHYGVYHLENPDVQWTLRGDTMNSYATTIGNFIQEQGKSASDHKREMVDDRIIQDTKAKRLLNKSKLGRTENVILRHYGDFRNVLPGDGQKYICLNHTIGNFIPVPFIARGKGEFNSPRGIGNSKDYWDLALMCIYNYYFSIQDSRYDLKWLLGNDRNVELCEKWLGKFGSGASGWDSFVKQNFMQAFVNPQKAHYGKPKELWKGHFEGEVMPKGKDYDQFLKNASSSIKARGEAIAQKIKDALKDKDLTALAKEMVLDEGKQ